MGGLQFRPFLFPVPLTGLWPDERPLIVLGRAFVAFFCHTALSFNYTESGCSACCRLIRYRIHQREAQWRHEAGIGEHPEGRLLVGIEPRPGSAGWAEQNRYHTIRAC